MLVLMSEVMWKVFILKLEFLLIVQKIGVFTIINIFWEVGYLWIYNFQTWMISLHENSNVSYLMAMAPQMQLSLIWLAKHCKFLSFSKHVTSTWVISTAKRLKCNQHFRHRWMNFYIELSTSTFLLRYVHINALNYI